MTTESLATPRFAAPAGEIIGWRDGEVLRATGIPYARAARFHPPEAEPAAHRAIHATTWAPGCPQNSRSILDDFLGGGMAGFPVTEDCLRLSVTRPAADAARPRPVMVWIHGGAYVSGAGDLPAYDPQLLVSEQDVVVVNVTFRLGLFGFVGDGEGRPANLGLLDLLAALQWVRTNIASFGGDPANVTVFGESAGADAVAHLMIAEGAEGLFHRVILQSAPLGISPGRSTMYAEMAAAAADIGADAATETVLRRQVRVERVDKRHGLRRFMPFGVQYGHAPLPSEDDLKEAWRRAGARFDVLLGTNDDEIALYTDHVPALVRVTSLPVVGPLIRRSVVRRLTDAVYTKATERLARVLTEGGATTYLYRLHYGRGRTPLGACHMMDLPLVLGTPETWADSRLVDGLPLRELRDDGARVRALWAGFARTGRLADEGRIEPTVLSWHRVTTGTRRHRD